MVDVYRSIDGSNNHPDDPDLGKTGSQFLRLAPASYADGYGGMAGADRPSAREVSNEIFAQAGNMPEPGGTSDFFWVWGQFIDHDMDLTRGAGGNGEAARIAVPAGDPWFDPTGTGGRWIDFTRSGYDRATGTDTPREQVNEITPFLDASMVYGSNAERAAALRDEGGYMKVSEGGLLPVNTDGLPNEGEQPGHPPGFLAGDVRANENAGLTSMHTLFVREHNRLVDELHAEHPDWNAEQLFQEAKAIVEGEIQAITFNEFLPRLIGDGAIPGYTGYKPDVDPQIANIFATAAFRFGHTMLSPELQRVTESGEDSAFGHLALRDAFFRPYKIAREGGIDEILRGLGVGHAQAVDAHIVDDVRNFLFGPPGAGGFDLAALNVQRGRDHGLADFNGAREAFGLPRVEDWSEITGDAEIQAKLKSLFGSVDNIDVWVGGLAEDPAPGALVGELFQTVIADQFTRLRDGDRFWYENRFSGEELERIEATSLSEIIQSNTGIDHLQSDLFTAYDRLGGTQQDDWLEGGDGHDLVWGGVGDDRIYGRGESDELFGDAGHDELYGGVGDDRLDGGPGDDWLVGGEDDDRLDGDEGDDALFGGPGDDVLLAGANNDDLRGGEGDDELFGEAGHDDLRGGRGDDWLDGGDGDDDLRGGRGDDVVLGGEGGDRLFAGAGHDELWGEAGHDALRGGLGDDYLDGGDGHDWLNGGKGADALFGGIGHDDLIGGLGDDLLDGGEGHDWLKGGLGDDALNGGRGHDELFAGGGDDRLEGGEGSDILNGGAGRDTFIFGENFGDDRITDFDTRLHAGDLLDFSEAGAAAGSITVSQSGCDTLITVGCAGTVRLENVIATEVDPSQHFSMG